MNSPPKKGLGKKIFLAIKLSILIFNQDLIQENNKSGIAVWTLYLNLSYKSKDKNHRCDLSWHYLELHELVRLIFPIGTVRLNGVFGLHQFTFLLLSGKAEVEKIGEELGLLVEQVSDLNSSSDS